MNKRQQKKRVCDMSEAASRQLYREKKFDDNIMCVLTVIGGLFFLMIAPIILAYAFAIFEYRLMPAEAVLNRPPYYPASREITGFKFSSVLIPASVIFSGVSVYYFARNHAVGNKYKIYLINEAGQLFYSHMGRNAIYSYYRKNVKLAERIKSTPNIIYGIFLMRGTTRLTGGLYMSRREQFFKYNQKHKLAQTLLSGNDYRYYCNQIVAVQKISFFKGGCTVTFSFLSDGVAINETCHIYTSMEGYDTVVDKLLKLYASTGRKPNKTLPACYEQQKLCIDAFALSQVRRKIIRDNALLLVFIIGMLVLAVLSLLQSEGFIDKMRQADYVIVSRLYGWLTARADRRVYLCVGNILVSILLLAKGMYQLSAAKRYTLKNVTVIRYYLGSKNVRDKAYNEFKHYALIEYDEGETKITASVGVSPLLYENKEYAGCALVMKSASPYMLVMK